MADINELRARLQQIKQQIIAKMPEFAERNTITAKALIERKIRETGFGSVYSQHPLPVFFFEGRAKSKAGEAYIEMIKKRDEKAKEGDATGMTWADLRRAEGLPVDHVDLGFTNKMWAGLLPQMPYIANGVITCPLGGSTQEVVDKLNWNRARYGDFLGKSLTQKEFDILGQVVLDEIGNIFAQNGFPAK